ncbi:phosphatidate cytidylyltransferase [Teredinibacter turnerae]|uniref:phosphatidate cytidylyltransferase n=1 Tax=Teredinibacter turnerae TaxID=2426 RepID=UPI000367BD4C|nr:phosphatidate cytidylyltransferase [Teredinibacter turnerae]
MVKRVRNWPMRLRVLKHRVITALVLVWLLIGTLFLGDWRVFAVVTGLVMALACWEWSDLCGLRSQLSRGAYTAVVAVVGVGLGVLLQWYEHHQSLRILLLIACAWWAVALLWVQSYPSSAILWGSTPVKMLMGLVILIPAWIALLYLRAQPAGAWLVLMAFLTVAAADVGAYFAGRRFGRTKLARNVSPGKTWEGVLGGMVLALLWGGFANLTIIGGDWLALLAVVVPTSLVSVVGDLLESMVKRQRGVKDSGRLLPGHGGFLDRIDGLVAAAPVFALAVLASGWTVSIA